MERWGVRATNFLYFSFPLQVTYSSYLSMGFRLNVDVRSSLKSKMYTIFSPCPINMVISRHPPWWFLHTETLTVFRCWLFYIKFFGFYWTDYWSVQCRTRPWGWVRGCRLDPLQLATRLILRVLIAATTCRSPKHLRRQRPCRVEQWMRIEAAVGEKERGYAWWGCYHGGPSLVVGLRLDMMLYTDWGMGWAECRIGAWCLVFLLLQSSSSPRS